MTKSTSLAINRLSLRARAGLTSVNKRIAAKIALIPLFALIPIAGAAILAFLVLGGSLLISVVIDILRETSPKSQLVAPMIGGGIGVACLAITLWLGKTQAGIAIARKAARKHPTRTLAIIAFLSFAAVILGATSIALIPGNIIAAAIADEGPHALGLLRAASSADPLDILPLIVATSIPTIIIGFSQILLHRSAKAIGLLPPANPSAHERIAEIAAEERQSR
jgi:hypothetical protein